MKERAGKEGEIVVTNGLDEIIFELKKEALAPDKPSAFGISKEEMLEKFKKKLDKGELTKETYELIKGSLINKKL